MRAIHLAAAVAVVTSVACGRGRETNSGVASSPETPSPVVTLAVPGCANATPSIVADGDLIGIAWGATAPEGGTDVFAAISRDAGRTFGSPVRVNAVTGDARLVGEGAPRIGFHRNSTGVPEVVVVWTARDTGTTIKQARSVDGGRTFESPVVLSGSNALGNRGWAALALDPAGAAHTIWLDHRGMASAGHTHSTGLSADAGGAAAEAVAMAQKSALYYVRNHEQERAITPGVCYCCKTAIAAGTGTIVAAWRHVYPGNVRDIAFTTSHDGGRTFADPVRVSEDKWTLSGCPDDGPAIAIDGARTAHVVWPTMLDGDAPQGAIFYASTSDGRTFTARSQVPTLGGRKPTHPQIAVDDAGHVAVAWDEQVGGERVAAVRFARRSADGTVSYSPDTRLGAGTIALYPVLAPTRDGVIAAWVRGGPDDSTIAVQKIKSPESFLRIP